jgi:hypothetical protein
MWYQRLQKEACMIARISTGLDAPAGRVWPLLERKETFLYVTRGLMGFSGAENWPEEWREGEEVVGRIRLPQVLPGWRHRIRLVSADKIEIHAGALTLAVWAFAHAFYRYRQARWRALAKVLP